MSARRPIPQVLADPAVPEAVKARLRLVDEVRAFSERAMGLAPGTAYSTYVALDRPWVTVAVTACSKTALEPYEWWFPVTGRVPYKGYFDKASAAREASELERKGYDTYLMEEEAYSTLGWYSDPVLSTMLSQPPHALAESLLHELAHGAVYFKGQGDFNEAAATFLGKAGAERFIGERFGQGSPEAQALADYNPRRERWERRLEDLYKELSILYAAPIPRQEKLARRETLFKLWEPRLELAPGSARLNNAFVLAHRRYRTDLEDFRRLHERLGSDFKKTIAALKALDSRRPAQALAALP